MSSIKKKGSTRRVAKGMPVPVEERPPQSQSVSAPVKSVHAGKPLSAGSRNEIILTFLLIIIATAIAYLNLYRNELISLDDYQYITANGHVQGGLSLEGVKWAFSVEDKNGNYWQPFTWLTLMGIYQIFGLSSAAFHLANLLIHILNSLLLFLMLKRMTGRIYPSGFVAILFALHPLNVEAVAWAVEIKTTASTLFGLLTIYLYAWYVEKKGVRLYAVCLMFFCLSLMFKPHLATLPFVLLLLDWWPLNRIDFSRGVGGKLSGIKALVFEKVPFIILSAASIIIAVLSLKYTNSMEQASSPGFVFRLENAAVSYAAYIFKMILPIRLAVYYPSPASYALWKPACAAALLISASFAVIRGAPKRPWLAVGWLWFIGSLFPMIGLVRGGVWPAMANRFTYFPMIGLFIVIVWACAETGARLHIKKSIYCCFAGITIMAMITASRHYLSYWENGFSLFKYALGVTEDNVMAYDSLGDSYMFKKDFGRAIECYEHALRISPENDTIWQKTGLAYTGAGYIREAQQCFDKSLKINSGNPLTHFYMGRLLAEQGRYPEAILECKAALELDPWYMDAREQLGIVYSNVGRQDEAIKEFSTILRRIPNHVSALGNLGLALARKGETQQALERYEQALRFDPDNIKILNNLGILLAGLRQYDLAAAQFEEVLRIEPNHLDAHINLGSIRGMQGKFGPAVEHLQKALQIDPNNELAKSNLEKCSKAAAGHN